jgi:prepilin-type N-terminal cleavage/methylation domain-containing protein
MIKRKGLTLLEVLISIFIMGIGMLSVLAMFPAAADMMGRAINNAQMAEGLVNSRGMYDGVDWTSSAYSKFVTVPIKNPNASPPITTGWFNQPAGETPSFLLLDQFAALGAVNRFTNLPIEIASLDAFTLNPIAPYVPAKIPIDSSSGNPSQTEIAGRFFTCNSDLILNKAGVANLDDDGSTVLVEREAKFTLAHFFTRPMPITYPNYIKRNILVFKDRSQVLTANDFTYYALNSVISSTTSTNQCTLSVNANGALKTRQWVMVTDSVSNAYPTAVDFFEIITVDDSGATTTIEINPALPLGFGTGAKSVYLLKDVARVVYIGY